MLTPILQRHPDLAYIRRRLVVKPIRHVLSGVLFVQVSGPGAFRPLWFVTHFFNPDAELHMGWSVELDWPRPVGWSTERADIEQLLKIAVDLRALRRSACFN